MKQVKCLFHKWPYYLYLSLHLKEEARDYLEPDTIKGLVKKYSQFINFNIFLWTSKTETVEEPVEEEEEKKDEAAEDKKDEKKDEEKKDEEKKEEEKAEEKKDEDKKDKDDDEAKVEEEKEEEKEKKPKTKKVGCVLRNLDNKKPWLPVAADLHKQY